MILTGFVEQVVMPTNGIAYTVTNSVLLYVESQPGDFVESWVTFGFWLLWVLLLLLISATLTSLRPSTLVVG